MPPAMDHAQTSHLAVLGSSTHCGGGPDEALGRVAREVVHPHCLGNVGLPKGPAAVARTGLGHAPGPVQILLIARLLQGHERVRRAPPDGRRSVGASRLPRCARISAALLTSCGRSKPFRIDPYGFQPAIHPSRQFVCPSDAHVLDDRDRDIERFASVRTSFFGGRNVFRG